MALINCPECSREVSDQAAACPHCGYPLRAKPSPAGSTIGDADARILQTLLGQGKIAAIKLCRELHPGMDLTAAKQRVDRLEATLPPQTRPAGSCLLLVIALLILAARCGASVFF